MAIPDPPDFGPLHGVASIDAVVKRYRGLVRRHWLARSGAEVATEAQIRAIGDDVRHQGDQLLAALRTLNRRGQYGSTDDLSLARSWQHVLLDAGHYDGRRHEWGEALGRLVLWHRRPGSRPESRPPIPQDLQPMTAAEISAEMSKAAARRRWQDYIRLALVRASIHAGRPRFGRASPIERELIGAWRRLQRHSGDARARAKLNRCLRIQLAIGTARPRLPPLPA